jgi:hypothetical protein
MLQLNTPQQGGGGGQNCCTGFLYLTKTIDQTIYTFEKVLWEAAVSFGFTGGLVGPDLITIDMSRAHLAIGGLMSKGAASPVPFAMDYSWWDETTIAPIGRQGYFNSAAINTGGLASATVEPLPGPTHTLSLRVSGSGDPILSAAHCWAAILQFG